MRFLLGLFIGAAIVTAEAQPWVHVPINREDLIATLRVFARNRQDAQMLLLIGYVDENGDAKMLTANDLRCRR